MQPPRESRVSRHSPRRSGACIQGWQDLPLERRGEQDVVVRNTYCFILISSTQSSLSFSA